MKFDLYIFIYSVFLVQLSHCSSHWTVTDDGLTIQSVVELDFTEPDSLYMIRQPHSLVQFLAQEQKLNEVVRSKRTFVENEEAIRTRESMDDPDLENKLRSTDPDCIRANKLNTNKETFLVSYSLTNILEDLELIVNNVSPIAQDEPKQLPYCKIDLPFSMYALEHFQAIQLRRSLTIPRETELNKTFPSRFQLDDFGHYVAKALEKVNYLFGPFRVLLSIKYLIIVKSEDVAALTLAAFYWRIRGNAFNAIECFRRSLHYSSREKRPEILFGLGNVLHKAGYSNEAATIYQIVLTELDDALVHLALGDALTLMLNRTEAIEEFEIAHSKDPSLDAIYKSTKKYYLMVGASALKCDLKLIKEMENQHNNLEETISLKNSQKERFERVRQLEESIRRDSADAETRLQSSLIYDYFTYDVDCHGLEQSGKSAMHCYLRESDWPQYRREVELRHQKMVKDVTRRVVPYVSNCFVAVQCDVYFIVGNQTVQWTVNEDDETSEELISFLEALKPMYGVTMDEPITTRLYPIKPNNANNKLLQAYMSKDWPDASLCDTNRWSFLPLNRKTIPQLFIHPDNKGFSVSSLLGKYLNLSPLQEHPLPWNSPSCGKYIHKNHPASSIFKRKGVLNVLATGRSDKFAEKDLKSFFKKLAGFDGIFADIAQRVHTLIHYEIGPRWIAFNLAALYWRIIGAPGLAVECLHAALTSNADMYADVALTQLAQLIIRFSTVDEHLDDAAIILNMAMRIDPNEPLTHLLSSIVNHLQQKHRAAVKYARAAIILDPAVKLSVDFMIHLKCHNKKVILGRKNVVWPMCLSSLKNSVYCLVPPLHGCYVRSNKRDFFEPISCHLIADAEDVCCNGDTAIFVLLSYLRINTTEVAFSPKKPSFWYSEFKENAADVIPLDYGGLDSLRRIEEISSPLVTTFSVSQTEVLYTKSISNNIDYTEDWEEDVIVDVVPFPEFPLSLEQIADRKQMLVFDAALPEVLPLPAKELVESGLRQLPVNKVLERSFCSNVKTTLSMLREQATSTWVSVTAKGVNMEEFMDLSAPVPALAGLEPVCPELDKPSPLKTFDHLPAYHLRDQFIFYKAEIGLEKAFKTLGNEKERIEHVAGRLMLAMKVSSLNSKTKRDSNAGVHWALSTASTLYWRVKGDAVNAIKCLRHSLNNAPSDMTLSDVALVSMANIYHQAGLLHSALISGGAALTISPRLVAVHVTLADIYASMVTYTAALVYYYHGDYQHALQFYYSTLSLQKNFGPAKDRIRAIYCHTGKIIEF
uniref:Tetratricopeptide repeat protein 17 n=1 Tax=Syphacia muris TaxID=451379 RepID=A0A158R5W3_9BILA